MLNIQYTTTFFHATPQLYRHFPHQFVNSLATIDITIECRSDSHDSLIIIILPTSGYSYSFCFCSFVCGVCDFFFSICLSLLLLLVVAAATLCMLLVIIYIYKLESIPICCYYYFICCWYRRVPLVYKLREWRVITLASSPLEQMFALPIIEMISDRRLSRAPEWYSWTWYTCWPSAVSISISTFKTCYRLKINENIDNIKELNYKQQEELVLVFFLAIITYAKTYLFIYPLIIQR